MSYVPQSSSSNYAFPGIHSDYYQSKQCNFPPKQNPWHIAPPKKSSGSLSAIADFCLPRSLVSGRRQLHIIPRPIEKMIGNTAFYLDQLSAQRSFRTEIVDGKKQSYQKIAEGILSDLVGQLPPEFNNAYPLRISVVSSNVMNAGAYPGGEIILNDKLIEAIFDAKRTDDISKCYCEKSDKSVYFDETSAKDALAAVIGHEMAHVYARHFSLMTSIKNIVKGLFHLLALGIKIVAHNFYYQTYLQAAKEANLDESWAKDRTKNKVQMIEKAIFISLSVFTIIWPMIQLYINRSCEFESDQWGMVCASNAGYDARGALLFQEVMKNARVVKSGLFSRIFEVFSTHPESGNRAEALVKELQKRVPGLVHDGDLVNKPEAQTYINPGYEDWAYTPTAPTVPGNFTTYSV